jgi:hypothetical protein
VIEEIEVHDDKQQVDQEVARLNSASLTERGNEKKANKTEDEVLLSTSPISVVSGVNEQPASSSLKRKYEEMNGTNSRSDSSTNNNLNQIQSLVMLFCQKCCVSRGRQESWCIPCDRQAMGCCCCSSCPLGTL